MSRAAEHFPLLLPAQLDQAGMQQFSASLAQGLATGLPLVLRGAAPGQYCRGLDLENQDVDLARAQDFAALLVRVWEAPVPTIAVVEGPAIGGGLGLAAACDRVLCTDAAAFGLPELLWGFVPAMIWPLVSTRMRATAARWWIITGRSRNAQEAYAAGLVDEVVDAAGIPAALNRCLRECSRADFAAIPVLRRLAAPDVAQRIVDGAALTAEQLSLPRVQKRLAAYAAGDTPW